MPTKEEFTDLLRSRDIEEIVRGYLFEGETHIFRSKPSAYVSFRARLGSALGCSPEDVKLVGSAKLGFSLDPDNYGKAFSARSDLDVVVVSAAMFDQAWIELVKAGPTTKALSYSVRNFFREHRRNKVFWGYIEPSNLRGAVTCYKIWFPAFQDVGAMPEIFGRVVEGRLYRTWDHAIQYHVAGARKILAGSGKVS